MINRAFLKCREFSKGANFGLKILSDGEFVTEINFTQNLSGENLGEISNLDENLKLCLNELKSYFSGELKVFKTKLKISGTVFQKDIYNALLKIPYAKTITYKELAQISGHSGAYRAAGNANAKNKIPIIIPCHRVVGTNSIGGYSGGKNLEMDSLEIKKYLLNLEKSYK